VVSKRVRSGNREVNSRAKYELWHKQWLTSGVSMREFASDKGVNYVTLFDHFKAIEAEPKLLVVVGR